MNSKEFKPVEGGNGCGAEPTEWMTILEKSYGSLDLRSFYWMRLSPFDDFAQNMQETEGEKQQHVKTTAQILSLFRGFSTCRQIFGADAKYPPSCFCFRLT